MPDSSPHTDSDTDSPQIIDARINRATDSVTFFDANASGHDIATKWLTAPSDLTVNARDHA